MTLQQRILSLSLLPWSFCVNAGFEMNFTPDNTGVMITCPLQITCTPDSQQTPFLAITNGDAQLSEIVTDDDSGLEYYHLIVGDPAAGFAQEVYIQRSVSFGTFAGTSNSSSASGGDPDDTFGLGGNGSDPLGITALSTGNGGGNPERVIMRQIVSDGELTMEFLKDQFDRKPVLTQTLNSDGITATVVIDMRNSTYSDMNTAGTMINTMSLEDTDVADFNFANDTQDSFVDAGRYTYTPGSGPGGSGGTYEYLDADPIDMSDIPWEVYFDPDTSGPWTFTENRPE